MDKLNLESIIKSFFLGGFIGLVLQISFLDQFNIQEGIIMILVSCSIGFIIGLITEVITALLPISIARPWTYFVINGVISLVITASILYLTVFVSSGNAGESYDLHLVIAIALFIVLCANVIDFVLYMRVQRRLSKFKATVGQHFNN